MSRGLERAELGGDVRALIAGYVIAGRLKLTEGDVKAAAEYLERARPLLAEAPFSDWTSRFERCQIDLWLAQDRLRSAIAWADETLATDALGAAGERSRAIGAGRVLIAKADAPAREQAVALLARLLQPPRRGEGRYPDRGASAAGARPLAGRGPGRRNGVSGTRLAPGRT